MPFFILYVNDRFLVSPGSGRLSLKSLPNLKCIRSTRKKKVTHHAHKRISEFYPIFCYLSFQIKTVYLRTYWLKIGSLLISLLFLDSHLTHTKWQKQKRNIHKPYRCQRHHIKEKVAFQCYFSIRFFFVLFWIYEIYFNLSNSSSFNSNYINNHS